MIIYLFLLGFDLVDSVMDHEASHIFDAMTGDIPTQAQCPFNACHVGEASFRPSAGPQLRELVAWIPCMAMDEFRTLFRVKAVEADPDSRPPAPSRRRRHEESIDAAFMDIINRFAPKLSRMTPDEQSRIKMLVTIAFLPLSKYKTPAVADGNHWCVLVYNIDTETVMVGEGLGMDLTNVSLQYAAALLRVIGRRLRLGDAGTVTEATVSSVVRILPQRAISASFPLGQIHRFQVPSQKDGSNCGPIALLLFEQVLKVLSANASHIFHMRASRAAAEGSHLGSFLDLTRHFPTPAFTSSDVMRIRHHILLRLFLSYSRANSESDHVPPVCGCASLSSLFYPLDVRARASVGGTTSSGTPRGPMFEKGKLVSLHVPLPPVRTVQPRSQTSQPLEGQSTAGQAKASRPKTSKSSKASTRAPNRRAMHPTRVSQLKTPSDGMPLKHFLHPCPSWSQFVQPRTLTH